MIALTRNQWTASFSCHLYTFANAVVPSQSDTVSPSLEMGEEKYTAPPKIEALHMRTVCDGHQLEHTRIRRAGGAGLAHLPSAVRAPPAQLPAQNPLHRKARDSFFRTSGQLSTPVSIHLAGR